MELIVFPNDAGVSIVIPLSDKYADKNMVLRPYHEFLFRKISEYIINKLGTGNIIDLGAWIGDNAVPWAKMIDKSRIVYAIDPSPLNCEYISTLCSLNNITNVNIIQRPISDKEELISTDGGLDLRHFTFNKNTEGKNKLAATSIDNLSETITNVSYIHLDVEGMEYDVLVGAKNLIATCRPIIAYEVHLLESNNVNRIQSLLKSWNYDIYLINEVLSGCNFDCRNCLALPRVEGYNSVDTILKIQDYLNEGTYSVITHVNNRIHKSNYTTVSEAMHSFSILRGGVFATTVLEHVPNGNPMVLNSYGIEKCVKECIAAHKQQYDNIFIPL